MQKTFKLPEEMEEARKLHAKLEAKVQAEKHISQQFYEPMPHLNLVHYQTIDHSKQRPQSSDRKVILSAE